jgi:rhamnulokinase
MAAEAAFLAVDLGAESGRVVQGDFDGNRIRLTELHRFSHRPIRIVDGLHWDVLRIMEGVQEGLARAAGATSSGIAGVGVDAWGVDFGLLDRHGALIANPYSYRDNRTDGMIERAFERASRRRIYQTTGAEIIQINTLYQLLAMGRSALLDVADTLLLIPDLINYWLTGEKACELTEATTTQLYDLGQREWAWELLKTMGIPTHIFPRISQPGTLFAPLLPAIVEETRLMRAVPVTSVASHDTESAVVAVPAQNEHFAYISSGTWSLVGIELPQPIVTDDAMEANFTNEGGFAGTTQFLKNLMGLWLLQECRRIWNQREGRQYSYDDLTRLAESSPAFGPVIDPDDARFLAPGDMPARIRSFCEQTGQQALSDPPGIVRCILESLALKYRWVLEQAERVTGRKVETIHIVGGGARNTLLCRLTAGATGRPVLAGPVEAAALGNVLAQVFAHGHARSLPEMRAIARNSATVETYEPGEGSGEWETAYERFVGVMQAHERVPSVERG